MDVSHIFRLSGLAQLYMSVVLSMYAYICVYLYMYVYIYFFPKYSIFPVVTRLPMRNLENFLIKALKSLAKQVNYMEYTKEKKKAMS